MNIHRMNTYRKTYIQAPRKYDNCPRCGSEWAEVNFKPTKMNRPLPIKAEDNCLSCGMRYLYSADKFFDNLPALVLRSFLGSERYHFSWYLKTKECVYSSLDDIVFFTDIKLPWQPFDITTEQVKSLLLEKYLNEYHSKYNHRYQ